MADDNKTRVVTLKTPSGRDVQFRVGADWNPIQIERAARTQRPELFARPLGRPTLAMNESVAPKIVRGAGAVLPAAGGLGGGILGAGAGGVAAPAGAGAGAVLGELGRTAINERVFGDARPASGKAEAKKLALEGGTAAGLEGLGGAAIGLGNRIIDRIALSRSTKEVGDVVQGLLREHPVGFSSQGLQRGLEMGRRELSEELGSILQRGRYNAPINLDSVLQPVYTDARAANAAVKTTFNAFDRIVKAAKVNSGIGLRPGAPVNPSQAFKFMREVAKDAYREGAPGPVRELLNGLLDKAYTSLGAQVRSSVPDAAPVLDRLTNLHAGVSAVKKYGPGKVASTLVTAATHPKATAAISPFATGAVAIGAGKVSDTAKKAAQEVIP